MALEYDHSYPPTLQSDLLKEGFVKKLIEEGRTPFIIARNFEVQLDSSVCFIPEGRYQPPQTIKISFEDAGRIAKIREKLTHKT